MLENYPDKAYIVEGFTKGFDLGYEGEQISLSSNNSLSVNNNIQVALDHIAEESAKGRIAGPFASKPFQNFICSPLALREKSTPGKFRLLHNLSYPYNTDSVNFNIPERHTKLKYASITDAIQITQLYHNCFMAKSDIAEAFRLIPLSPDCYNLLGFKLEGKYYYDRCLPMGASSACKIFEKFSDSLKFILKSIFKVKHVVKVIDDFLFIGKTYEECNYALNSFRTMCKFINVPIAEKKTVDPTHCLTFLGIQLDTLNNIASIPRDKILSYKNVLLDDLKKDELSLKDLQSLIGKLQFSTVIITCGRCFLRRLYNGTIGKTSPHSRILITDCMKADLKIWLEFLESYNGKSIISPLPVASSQELHFYTDSSKSGYGGTFNKSYILGIFPTAWKALDIQFLELYPIFLLVMTFSTNLKNSSLTFHCDNLAIVHIINNQTSKSPKIMSLLRPLVLELLKNNINFKAMHIPGLQNTLCDALSRQQVSRSLLRQYGMVDDPTPVPWNLLPHNWRF